ncbi:hypothetical protein TNCV_911471 [Trichonephila clavipes]|nr:hypothetical protein TNCV_911471 [Trichonephila clavipes]
MSFLFSRNASINPSLPLSLSPKKISNPDRSSLIFSIFGPAAPQPCSGEKILSSDRSLLSFRFLVPLPPQSSLIYPNSMVSYWGLSSCLAAFHRIIITGPPAVTHPIAEKFPGHLPTRFLKLPGWVSFVPPNNF